jgi:hypothetical protein
VIISANVKVKLIKAKDVFEAAVLLNVALF